MRILKICLTQLIFQVYWLVKYSYSLINLESAMMLPISFVTLIMCILSFVPHLINLVSVLSILLIFFQRIYFHCYPFIVYFIDFCSLVEVYFYSCFAESLKIINKCNFFVKWTVLPAHSRGDSTEPVGQRASVPEGILELYLP